MFRSSRHGDDERVASLRTTRVGRRSASRNGSKQGQERERTFGLDGDSLGVDGSQVGVLDYDPGNTIKLSILTNITSGTGNSQRETK
jgi:hypothetical protein